MELLEFQDKYSEDGLELIENLEKQLLGFEKNPNNSVVINEIFRAMHTLKGSATMFGFDKIGKLTHALEDIYVSIRSGETAVNSEIITLTFESIDIIKILLKQHDQLNVNDQARYNTIGNSLGVTIFAAESIENQPIIIQNSVLSDTLYKILFKPDKNVRIRGLKPENIKFEFDELGENLMFDFEDETIQIENEYENNKYWEFFIYQQSDDEKLKDIFLFYSENEYSIEKISTDKIEEFQQILSISDCVNHGKIALETLYLEINKIKPEIDIVDTKQENVENIVSINTEQSIRIPSSKLDILLSGVSDLITLHSHIKNITDDIDNPLLTKQIRELSKISKLFRDEIISMRLLPINTILTSLQRLIRDLSEKLKKDVDFETDGMHTKLDKNMLQRLEPVLLHLLRNAMDHGVESAEIRKKNNKSVRGIIRFTAFYSGTNIFIQIQDDGAGINPETIRKKAIEKGLLDEKQNITHEEIFAFLFTPGFSTANVVSEISGRGVGLDVVKKELYELHGEITINSEIGLGTSFTIKLPLSLTILDALLCKCHHLMILIPVNNIITCKVIHNQEITTNQFIYKYEDKGIPIIHLSKFFDENSTVVGSHLIVFEVLDKRFALVIAEIMNTLQAVIKPLGVMHKNLEYFTGVSILGNGKLAYILDLNHLVKNFLHQNKQYINI